MNRAKQNLPYGPDDDDAKMEAKKGWEAEHRRPGRLNIAAGILAFFAMLMFFLLIAFNVIRQITAITDFELVMGSGLLAFVLFFLTMALLSFIRIRIFKHTHRIGPNDALLNALAEIAAGNYDIFLDADPADPFSEMAGAINEMAKNLGTVETLRQDFISNISHEIQSPLTSIAGFAKLLQQDSLPETQRRHYCEIIESESLRMSAMSENLLKLSTLDSGIHPLNPAAFRLDQQLQDIILALEPQWTLKALDVELDTIKLTVEADESLLAQVWTNLLTNAIKFTPRGGTIVIKGTSEMISIADSGLGMSKEDQLRIFERFYKADKSRDRSLGGNGLGLAIVKKIIDLHGGTVAVDSELRHGTVVKIKLPSLHAV
jgi:signal transduction histidine kinase